MTTNKTVLSWIDEMAAMCTPDKIVWIDGSDEQRDALRAEAVATGEMIEGDLPKKAQELIKEWWLLHHDSIEEMWNTKTLKKLPPLE